VAEIGGWRPNTMQKYTHRYLSAKMITVITNPGIEGGR
jgi:hypothetical protein